MARFPKRLGETISLQLALKEESLSLHRKLKGKLDICSKVSIRTKTDLSLAYTPGVAEPSRLIAADHSLVDEYTGRRNTVAVVSDGSAVLGLGNIGPEAALPVMEGKAILFKEFAGINAFPLCLATQEPKAIIETVKNIAPVFGAILIEDIKAPECFEVEQGLQELGIPVMHDDQHGTAVVVLAALINALKVAGKKLQAVRVVVSGAGAAGTATIKMLRKHGVPRRHLLVCDSKGIVSMERPDVPSTPCKRELAGMTNEGQMNGTLADAMKGADVFIGVSKNGLVSEEMVRSMATDAIVFAMANPEPEIMPDQAKRAGAAVVATGRSDFPNQVNNVLGFPGIFRGALDCGATRITDEMKLAAAEKLASLVKNPTRDMILPSPLDKSVVPALAEAVKRAWEQSGT